MAQEAPPHPMYHNKPCEAAGVATVQLCGRSNQIFVSITQVSRLVGPAQHPEVSTTQGGGEFAR